MKFKLCFLFIIPLILLSSCGLMPQKHAELAPSRETIGLGEVVTLPAQLRILEVKKYNSSVTMCAEPVPDVALSDTFKLITGAVSDSSATAKTNLSNGTTNTTSDDLKNKIDLKNDLQTATTALELAGRTQLVLLAREFMFRTCEAAANGWIDGPNVLANQKAVIDSITKLADSDKTKADTAKTKADTEAKVTAAALDDKVLQSTSASMKTALVNACTNNLVDCVSKPKIDDKAKAACQVSFNECMK
jgi:hypothetical protein